MLTDDARPTHRVVCRLAGPASDDPSWIAVENSVVGVAIAHGTALHVTTTPAALDRMVDTVVRDEFVQVTDSGRLSGDTEFRADADSQAAAQLLAGAFEAGDEWADRVFAIDEFAVVGPEGWLYRSVPHHAHIRELDADGAKRFLRAVRAAVSEFPRTAVVPDEPLVTWTEDGERTELWPTTLRRGTGQDRSAFALDRLASVRPTADGVALRWQEPASTLARLGQQIRRTVGTTPPARLSVPDEATRSRVQSGLAELADELGYGYTVG